MWATAFPGTEHSLLDLFRTQGTNRHQRESKVIRSSAAWWYCKPRWRGQSSYHTTDRQGGEQGKTSRWQEPGEHANGTMPRAKGPSFFFFFILQRMQTSKSSHFTDQTTQSGRLCGWVTEPIWLTKEAWARAPARDEDIWEKKESRWPRLTLSKSCETQWNTKGGKQKQSIQSLEVLSLNDFTVYMIIYTCRYNFLKIKPTWKIN